MKKLGFIFVILYCNVLLAQIPDVSKTEIRPIIPGANLIRFIDYPISYSYGTSNVTIPIYTIKSGSLEIPISLSYHSGGIRVDDESTEIGLGWMLNIGGNISKSIKGQPDDRYASEGGFIIKTREEILAQNDHNYLLQLRHTSNVDSEHDQYYYDCGGDRGSFIYDYARRKVYQIPITDNKIIINRDFNDITSMEIQNNKGIRYLYELADITECQSAHMSYDIHPQYKEGSRNIGVWYRTKSQWLLTKIISADRADSIVFTYHKGELWEDMSHYKTVQEVNRDGTDAMSCETNQERMSYTICENINVVNYKYAGSYKIKNIKFSVGEIEFSNLNDRTDDVMPERLSSITVRGTDLIQKTILYNNHYFQCGRMKLVGFETYGKDNEIIDRYKFDYNEQYLTPRHPDHNIYGQSDKYYGQDAFGFYNGVETNSHLSIHDLRYAPTSNREYSFLHAQNLCLKKITGITGGYTCYSYEANDTNLGIQKGIRLKEIGIYDYTDALVRKKNYTYNKAHMADIGANSDKIINNYVSVKQTSSNAIPVYHKHEKRSTICFLYTTPAKITTYYPSVIIPGARYENFNIQYGEVTEIIEDGSGDRIKTIYEYGDHPGVTTVSRSAWVSQYKASILNIAYVNSPYIPVNIYFQSEPYSLNLLRQSTYLYKNGLYFLNEEVCNKYKVYDKIDIHGGVYSQGFSLECSPGQHTITDAINDYYLFNILIPSCRKLLVESIHRKYYGNDTIIEVKSYMYDTLTNNKVNNANVKSFVRQTTLGTYRNDYLYPTNFKSSIYKYMTSNNMISPIITNEYYVNNIEIKSLHNEFITKDNPSRPTMILPSEQYLMVDGRRTAYVNTLRYTNSGRPSYVLANDNPATVYLWGYNSQHPVAIIKNATYEEVEQILSPQNILSIENNSTLSYDQKISINNLRTALPNAHITTYTYYPLIGISSMTDPSGRITYYEYDNANRIKTVKDDKQNIIEAYQYNYIDKQ